MNKIEDVIMVIAFGAVIPISLFLAGWWSTIGLVPENTIFVFALIGLTSGIIIDILFLRKWLRNIYKTGLKLLVIIYLFYSVCTFGFFMGVPVFNLLPGILAGIYTGRRLNHNSRNKSETEISIKNACIITTSAIVLISAAAAFFALKDPMDTARNLEGMFNLKSFTITTEMIIGLILTGGTVLAISQYWMTKKAALFAFRHGSIDN